jgi:hypothetical protein
LVDVGADMVTREFNVDEIPRPPVTGQELKSLVSQFRTAYELAFRRFSQSGQYADGGQTQGESDKDFRTNFAQGDYSLYFAFILFNRTCPPIAGRCNPEGVSLDIGVSQPATPSASRQPSPGSAPLSSTSSNKRKAEDMTTAYLKAATILAESFRPAAPGPNEERDSRARTRLLEAQATEAETRALRASLEAVRDGLTHLPDGSEFDDRRKKLEKKYEELEMKLLDQI